MWFGRRAFDFVLATVLKGSPELIEVICPDVSVVLGSLKKVTH